MLQYATLHTICHTTTYNKPHYIQKKKILPTTLIKERQDGQCTYNVTLMRVRVTIVAVEKQKVLNILSLCL